MKIKFIEKIKEFFEMRRLKRLSDTQIINEMKEMVREEPEKISEKVPNMIDSIEKSEKVIEALDTVAPILEGNETKMIDEVIKTLPERETIEAIKNPIIIKNVPIQTISRLANTTSENIIKNILKETYRRAGKQSDSTIIGILKESKKGVGLSEECINTIKRIIAKQMAYNYVRFGFIKTPQNFLEIYPVGKHKINSDQEIDLNEEKLELLNFIDREFPKVEEMVKFENFKYKEMYQKSKNKRFMVNPTFRKQFSHEDYKSQMKESLIIAIIESFGKDAILTEKGREEVKDIIIGQMITDYMQFGEIKDLEGLLKVYPAKAYEKDKLEEIVDLIQGRYPKDTLLNRYDENKKEKLRQNIQLFADREELLVEESIINEENEMDEKVIE